MSGVNGVNGNSPFYVELCGDRTLFRLMKSTCFWIKDACGKSEFAIESSFLGKIPLISGFAKCTIDLNALSNTLVKYDGALYVAGAVSSGIECGSTIYKYIKGSDGKTCKTYRDLIYDGLKFGSNLLGGLKWATKGISALPIINHYGNQFSIAKAFFSASTLSCDIYHKSKRQWTIYWNPKNTIAEQEKDNLEWKMNGTELGIKIATLGLNIFAFLDGALKPVKPMNGMVYNLLGTIAGINGLFLAYYKNLGKT